MRESENSNKDRRYGEGVLGIINDISDTDERKKFLLNELEGLVEEYPNARWYSTKGPNSYFLDFLSCFEKDILSNTSDALFNANFSKDYHSIIQNMTYDILIIFHELVEGMIIYFSSNEEKKGGSLSFFYIQLGELINNSIKDKTQIGYKRTGSSSQVHKILTFPGGICETKILVNQGGRALFGEYGYKFDEKNSRYYIIDGQTAILFTSSAFEEKFLIKGSGE